ncbi:MAG: hypothetical protein WCP14_02605 [bacterium]
MDNKEKAEKIEELYQRSLDELTILNKKQMQIIRDFHKKLEEIKIKEIQNKLGKNDE